MKTELYQVRQALAFIQHWQCAACGKTIGPEQGQIAHRIPQRKWCIKHFGRDVIHHPMNMVLVCNLECNAKVQLNPDSLEAERLARKILREITRSST